MRKDKVLRLLQMGRHNLIRSEDQAKDTLMISDEEMEDNFVKSEEEEVGDVMSRLFDWDFDQLLRQIFTSLDPVSLRACRQVCRCWRSFISDRLMGVPHIRTNILRRLWSNPMPLIHQLKVSSSVASLALTGSRLAIGFNCGAVEVLDANRGELVARLEKPDGLQGSGCRLQFGHKHFLTRAVFGTTEEDNGGGLREWHNGAGRLAYHWDSWDCKNTGEKLGERRWCGRQSVDLRTLGKQVLVREGGMLSLLSFDNQEERMVEQGIGEAGEVGRGDMACDGDWLVMGCQAGVAWSKVGQELMQLNTEEVVQVGLIPPHVLLLHSTSVSILHLPTGSLTTSVVTSPNLLLSLSINSIVAVLLDCQNNLSFHLLSSLTKTTTNSSSSTSSSPIASLQLPMPPCPYSSPRVAISDVALAAAAVGSNRVFVYQLWSGRPHVDNPKLLKDPQKKRKKLRQEHEEMEERQSEEEAGEAGHGEARRAHREVGQSEGEAEQARTGADRQEHGEAEGRRRKSGDGGRDLL